VEELKRASQRIGFESVEHAFWILIPKDESVRAQWMPAVGQAGSDLSSRMRLPVSALYSPSKNEVESLLSAARGCDWVVHVHNHPIEPYPGTVTSSGPSGADLRFAIAWRERFSEVSDTMRFFVIKGETAVEYGVPEPVLMPDPEDFRERQRPFWLTNRSRRIHVPNETQSWIDRLPPRVQDRLVWLLGLGVFIGACAVSVFLYFLRRHHQQ
jgi:hypothetical protein